MSLLPLLGVGRGDVVAVAGAGGKTSLVSALSEEARRGGLRVVEAATAQRKLPSIDPERIAGLRAESDLVLVECDGARGRWLKTPAEHEPVVPACASLLLVVASLEAFGRPLGADVVHRPERVGVASGRAAGSVIDAWVVARALASGYPERRPAGARLVAFLNAVEHEEAWVRAIGVASGLVPPYDGVVAGSARQGQAARVPVLCAVVLAQDRRRRAANEGAAPVLRAVRALLAAGLQRVHVAVGRDTEVASWLPSDPRVELLPEDDATGQAGAAPLRSAIGACGDATEAALIVPSRGAELSPALVGRLLLTALERAPLVAARAAGAMQALLVPRELFPELLSLEPDADLEELLRRHPDRAAYLATRDRDVAPQRRGARV